VSSRSEYLSAALWAAFGVIVMVASWRLDRLENLGINPWSVPGLTPGVVGALIVLLAIALAIQARCGGAGSDAGPGTGPEAAGGIVESAGPADGSLGRTLAACTLCLLFAGVSLGHGLPFVVEGAAFVFLFTTVFSWSQWRADGGVLRKLLITLVVSVLASVVISWLFESVFLVRLP
jgi:hypothetical protein